MKVLVAVSGLKREARILSGASAQPVIGGGDSAALRRKLETALAPGADGIRGVISIGLAGALDSSLGIGDCVVARWIWVDGEKIACDESWTMAIRTRLGGRASADSIAGVDRVAVTRQEKSVLFDRTRAAAVDMESHVAALFAHARGIPFVTLRVVSDLARRSLPECARVAMARNGGIDMAAVMKSLAMHPLQLGDVVRTARDAHAALAALAADVRRLGPYLACPYPD